MAREHFFEETPTATYLIPSDHPTVVQPLTPEESPTVGPPPRLPPPTASGSVDEGPPTGAMLGAIMTAPAYAHPATWAPGAVIPGTVYRVIRPLGVGGMGEVYEAEHELLGVRRALKVLSRKLASREDLAERLRIEARALARLKHPNLIEVNDLGVSTDGRVFFAMELLNGVTLRDLLRRSGALRVDQAIALAAQVLDALDAAHQEGMVHRDVKPENIFVQRSGVVKLLDFGVAKALQGNNQLAPLTAAGVTVGTPRYMAPEQAQGQPVDQRTDVYALGLVFWEMLAGRLPFHQLDGFAAVVTAAAQGLPDISADGGPTLPPDVKAALERATARLPDDRYRSASAFAADLRMARARLDGSSPATSEKVTARYETSLTSLMPILADVNDGDTSPAAYATTAHSTPTHASNTTDGYAVVHTAELRIAEPTEAFTLRDSLPLDPRELPTPTSVPAQPPRASVPSPPPRTSLPSPAPAPAAAPPRPALWLALPLAMAATALGTWLLVRPAPAPPPAAVQAPAASVEPARLATSHQAPAAPASAEPPAAAPVASVVEAPPTKTAAPTKAPGKVAAGKPAAKPPSKVSTLPGSGL